MPQYVVHNASGRILRSGSAPTNGAAQLQARSGETVFIGVGRDDQDYVDNGAIVSRPQITLPTTHTLPANTDWTITPVPNGTEVYIDGLLAASITDGEAILTFPEAGVWAVEMRPPFPWRDATSEVTVT